MSQINPFKDDINIPVEFQSGCNILANHTIADFLKFIFQDDIFPLSPEIKHQIEPKSDSSFEFERCFNIFITLYKSNGPSFRKVPIFVLIYCSICLQNKILYEITSKFITEYLNSLKDQPNEMILDIFIPFSLFNLKSKEDFQICIRLLLFLCEKYSSSTFFNHFLPVLAFLIKNSEYKINHFHMEILQAIIETYNIDANQIDEIKNAILKPLESDESVLLIKSTLSISEMLNIESDGEIKVIASNPINFIKESDEIFEQLLKEVASKSFISAPIILGNIRVQLDRRSDFHFDIRPLFELAMSTYPESNEITRSNIYCIISTINQHFYQNPEELLNIYIDAAKSKKYDLTFLNTCYQEFLQTVTDDLEIYGKYSQLIDSSPINLFDSQLSQPIRSNAIKRAFNKLKKWDTAYDGVQKVWNEIIKNPDICLFDDIKSLEYSQKYFLLQGLQANLEFSEPILGVNSAIDKIAEFIDSLEQEEFVASSVNMKKKTVSPK